MLILNSPTPQKTLSKDRNMEAVQIRPEDVHHRFPQATANLKASGSSLKEVYGKLNVPQRELFRKSAFGVFLDLTIQGDGLLFHMMMLHQIRPNIYGDADGQKRLHFKVGNYRLAYGIEEFCLITGFRFGWYPNTNKEKLLYFGYKKNGSEFRKRVFPERVQCDTLTVGEVQLDTLTVGEVADLVGSEVALAQLSDEDVVRCALLYTLMTAFLAKERNDTIKDEWLCLVDDLDKWNSYAWGSKIWDVSFPEIEGTWTKFENYLKLDNPKGKWAYSVSGFTTPFKVWIWETLKVMKDKHTIKMNDDIPRIRRWMHTKQLRWGIVKEIFEHTKEKTAPILTLKPSPAEEMSDYYRSLQLILYEDGPQQVSPRSSPRSDYSSKPDISSARDSQSGHRKAKHASTREDLMTVVTCIADEVKGVRKICHGFDKKFERVEKFISQGYPEGELKDMVYDDPIPTFVNTRDDLFFDMGGLMGNSPSPRPTHNDTYAVNDESGMTEFGRTRSPRNGGVKNETVRVVKDESGKGCQTEDVNVSIVKEKRKPTKLKFKLPMKTPVVIDVVNVEDKFTTPLACRQGKDRPKRQIDPSRFLRSPYTQVQSTRRIPRRGPIVDTSFGNEKNMDLPPPPLLLEPYVSSGMQCMYLFSNEELSFDARHRLLPSVRLDKSFWGKIFHKEKGGWMDSEHVHIWVRLLIERMPDDATWCVMSDTFFAFMSSNRNTEIAMGKGDVVQRSRPWWEIDRVLFPINVKEKIHWVLGELWLDTLNFNLYDSISDSGSFELLRDEGAFDRFEDEINEIMENIDYWSKAGSSKTKSKIIFTQVAGLPQQEDSSGDCGVFMLMFMEQLVSGRRVGISRDSLLAGTLFRNRMASIIWGSMERPL